MNSQITAREAYYSTARELRRLTAGTGEIYIPTGIRLPLPQAAIERLLEIRKKTDRLSLPARRNAMVRAHDGLAAFRRGENLFEETEEEAVRSVVGLARQGFSWEPASWSPNP